MFEVVCGCLSHLPPSIIGEVVDILDLCFEGLNTGKYIELSIGGIDKTHRRWITVNQRHALKTPEELDVFFGPVLRDKSGVMGKANCLGTQVLWVDIDSMELIPPILPPTAIIRSGHGYHLYWRLTEFQSDRKVIETLNAGLAQSISGDSCHNIDRVMRIPGTYNCKDPDDLVKVICDKIDIANTYSVEDIEASLTLEDKMARKIRTGDRRGYKSRSERDWAIVTALLIAEMSDQGIKRIFSCHECGDKYETGGDRYLDKTIEAARESLLAQPIQVIQAAQAVQTTPVVEKDNSYWMASGKGAAQVSTFTLEPLLLLEGDEDAYVCNVRAQGTRHVWKDEVFKKSELGSIHRLRPRLNRAAWNWLGRDSHVGMLAAYLIKQLQEKGVPLAKSTKVMGRHELVDDDRIYFVTDKAVIASDGSIWADKGGSPIVYVPRTKNVPAITIQKLGYGKKEATIIAKNLPLLHEPDRIWPMIGWYAATPMKPAIEDAGWRFPILSVSGTKGSGKTTLILRVFLRMMGYTKPKGYEANTTRFVLLALLGSTNAAPLAFSEFRANMTKDFLRYVLISYDSGVDARGRPDQEINEYPLLAPFSLDGEDKLQDPAALERIISVHLAKDIVLKDTPAWIAYQKISKVNLEAFAYPYILHTLQGAVLGRLEKAQEQIDTAFVYPMPDRIRRNLAVAWMGITTFTDFMGMDMPDIEVMRHALENVYVIDRGRAPIAADDFVEFVVNIAANKQTNFAFALIDGVIWFHVTPAYHAYATHAARMGTPALSKAAMVSQLNEMEEFILPPRVMRIEGKMVRAHGINLQKAHDAQLDIPSSIDLLTWTIK